MSEIAIGRPGADKLNPDKLEAIMVSMRGNEGQAIKFTRPRISESLVWKYILQSEKMFGYDKKIKQELLEAIARRRNNSKSLPVADNVILLNNKQFHPIPPSHSAAQESNNSINSNSTPPQNVVQKGDTKDLNKFIEMISQGIPQSEIAEYFGFGSQGTVSKKLKQYLEKVEALVAKNVKVEEIAVQMNCSPKTVLKIYKMFKQKESQDAPNHQKVSSSHAMVVSQ
jgi:DNA-binding CsgD family transcriptional regulator